MSEPSASSPTPVGPVTCPQCGAVNSSGGQPCWLCRRPLDRINTKAGTTNSSGGSPTVPVRRVGTSRGPATYSLSTLMLLVTLAAVLCGLTAAAPGLGIPLAVLVTPALIRTFAVSNVSRAQGIEPSAEAKLASFVASIGLMLLIVVAGFAVFFVGCCAAFSASTPNQGGLLGNPSLVIIILTFIAVAAVMIWLFIKYWPRRSRGAIPDNKPPSNVKN